MADSHDEAIYNRIPEVVMSCVWLRVENSWCKQIKMMKFMVESVLYFVLLPHFILIYILSPCVLFLLLMMEIMGDEKLFNKVE